MSNNVNESQIKDIEALVRGSTVHVIAADTTAAPFALVPPGYKLEDLEKLLERPRRIVQTADLTSIESFIAYVMAHKEPQTVIFASDSDRRLRAAIDYHESADLPSWCRHQATYEAKLSREAKAWFGADGNAMSQVAFAEFLEEHADQVVAPAGAALLEQALKLQVIQKAVFGSAMRLQTGEFQLNWSQENEKGTVELPERIRLGIPIFHRGPSYAIEARLRYRVSEGKVAFTYKIIEKERAIEHAFEKVVEEVRTALALPIYFGSR